MKKIIVIACLCVGIVSYSVGQTFPDEIKTLSGRTYSRVKLQNVSSNGITIIHTDAGGAVQWENIALTNLSDDLRKKIGNMPATRPKVFSNLAPLIITNETPKEYQTIKTIDGMVYKVMSVDGYDVEGIFVTHIVRGAIGGIYHTKLKFGVLPDDIRTNYYYDPEKYAAFEQASQQRMLELKQIKAQQDAADAAKELALQQKRAADAEELAAKAAMLQATNQLASTNTVKKGSVQENKAH
jgi:hypothetical protein